MQLTRMIEILPERHRQTASSSCPDTEANIGLYLLSAFHEKYKPKVLNQTFSLASGEQMVLPTIQKSEQFGARNYLVYKGEFAGFIGCSWSGELRRPLMLRPQGTSYHIYLLQEEAEELFPDQPTLYEDDGWYPNLIKTVLTEIVRGFDSSTLEENMNIYEEYLKLK